MEDVKNDIKKKNIIIGILSLIIVVLLIVGVYFLFIKNDKKDDGDSKKAFEIKNVVLESSNKEVNFNGKKVNLKVEASKIYFNDKVVTEIKDYENFGVYVLEKIMLIYWPGEQCHATFIGAINEKGEFVEVKNDNNYAVNNLYLKDGNIFGNGYECSLLSDDQFNVKLDYDGKQVTIVEAS